MIALQVTSIDPQSYTLIVLAGDQAFQEGMQFRENRDKSQAAFRQAAEYYDRAVHDGRCRGPALFLRQGNAHFLAGELPEAILAYRRGVLAAPRDERLRANLAYAREQVAYPQTGSFARPPREDGLMGLPPTAQRPLFYAAFLFYLLLNATLTGWLLSSRRQFFVAAAVSLVSMALFAACFMTLWRQQNDRSERPLTVVRADGVLLRTGNGLSYPPRSETPLHRGVEARLMFQKKDWLQIELGSGEIGWIPRAYALVDDGT